MPPPPRGPGFPGGPRICGAPPPHMRRPSMVPVVRRAAVVPVVWRPMVWVAMRAPNVWAHRRMPMVPQIAWVRPAPGPVATARIGVGGPRADPPG